MSHLNRNRSHLLMGCGSAALALALALAPQAARAQGIQASGNVVVGSAEIVDIAPNETNIDVFAPTVVIDWTPAEDAAGNALDFLPAGRIASFTASSFTDYAVLNRILPATNGNVAVINGSVISRVTDIATGASVPGGFVAFYSPTGLLIGSTATFDVGQLLLTTLDPDIQSFQAFSEFGGNLALNGAAGSTARIQINPGAQILATPENSFFAVVAADVQMLGTARINGSHAYVAGEVVNLSFSNGLFNISVPVGTAAGGNVMQLDGDIGGPSSNGAGDNHMIYALAAAQADPISMIFRGNLGFDPAQSAGIVNGEIILAANYNVFGRFVDGGSVSDGINAVFGANSATSATRADIFLEDFAASSSLLAIGTHRTQVTAFNAASSVAGNLLMVGRENAELTASNGQTFTISGDVLVSAQDYGVVSSSLQNLDLINAEGGVAFIDAFGGGTMNIGGSALVTADAFAGAQDLSGIAGTAQGGQAIIGSTGGTLTIAGNATASARGVGTSINGVTSGATVRGGLAQFFARQGGTVTLVGNLSLNADATGAQGSLTGPSTVSDAFGGQAFVNIFDGGGSLSIGGDGFASASGRGGSSNNAGAGSVGDGGVAIFNVNGGGQINLTGRLALAAEGVGGTNAGGTGGIGYGGRASSAIFGSGTIGIGTDFDASALGAGGDGQTGGAGFGGIAGAIAELGSTTIGGRAFALTEGSGGDASFGLGGNGGLGRGGNSFFQANGTLTQTASLSIGGDAVALAQGSGGFGGAGDGATIAAGRGGDGYGGQFSVANQADPAFNSGAFILAGGDNGNISVSGFAQAVASGFAGQGGDGGSVQSGGRGGDGFGGLAQVGLALLGGTGAVGLGTASFASLQAEANGFGGNGGFSFGNLTTGDGGNGTGGRALLQSSAGSVIAVDATMSANGGGGGGTRGGNGTGGERSGAVTNTGGTITLGSFSAFALGSGGFGYGLGGGNGLGGQAFMGFQGGTTVVNGDVTVDATGYGGDGFGGGNGGNGTGGIADLAVFTPTIGSGTITGNAVVAANGIGGSVGVNGTTGGNGFGGRAFIQSQVGGTVRIGSAQVTASGRGGGQDEGGGLVTGGNGTGGIAELLSSGAGSQLIIERNVPSQLANRLNAGAIVGSIGIGATTTGGTGIGGTGTGGTATISASAGGSIALPATPFADPDSVGFIRLFARGFGGNTTVNGGTGGTSFGGNATIDVNGGAISMGEAVLSSFTQAGTGQGTGINVTGGNAFAGSRTVRITNGGTSVLNLIGGAAGAQGGAGTGTGNGGNAYIGQNLFLIENASSNIIGPMAIFDQSAGGTGQQGGNVFNVNPLTGVAGSLNLTLNGATITFTPDASGTSGIGLDFITRGGDGVVRGGNAQGPIVNVSLNPAVLLGGGFLTINPVIQGGNASALDGIGGDALGSLVTIGISNSTLNLAGETLFAADAFGGTGGANGTGGTATSGALDALLTNSVLTLVANQQGAAGILRVRSRATGGQAGTVGNATASRALLNLTGSTLSANSVYVESRALAGTSGPGQVGGAARSGEARIGLFGVSGITADLVELNASASSSQGGGAIGGVAVLQAESGATATVTAPLVNLLADAVGGADNTAGIAGATQGGQALVSANGGNLTITGNLTATARGLGATSANLLSGAASRGGVAQAFARLGGNFTLNGSLLLDASATGATGSLSSPSSVSDAFGGTAIINIGQSGGTITINGEARALANARGGSSNSAGAGSLGDAGSALTNILAGGLITVTGRLTLDAHGSGGNNSGGTGGIGRGGRASMFVENGGTIRVGSLDADALGVGGNGRSGGDGLGGIAGAAVNVGAIEILGRAFGGTEGVGGNASFGFGGNGGTGRGGNSFFQANGTLTQTATITINGDAIAFAQGVGGDGGDGNGGTIAAGRGGDAYGGQFAVPNQADPAFGSGAYLLAGGDNGAITVTGEAVAVASAFAGDGGDGFGTQAGGRGGDGFGGLAQVGLALLGQNGSLGQGSASFDNILAEANGFGGLGGNTLSNPVFAGGAGNNGIAHTGDGGNGTGGDAFLTVRAGDVTADQVLLTAGGYGAEGALSGFGVGGQAALFGGLGGTFAANLLEIYADGFGGDTLVGTGGNAEGGLAAIEGDNITITVTGYVLLDASAAAGISGNGPRGNAFGGEAILSVLDGNPAQITIGSLEMLADATSGISNTAGRFSVDLAGGNATLGSLNASSLGNAVNVDLPDSQLRAIGGNLNVTGALTAATFGDLLLETGAGGIIGSAAVNGTTTVIDLDAAGTIEFISDGTAGGVGGQSITALAGRSIVIGGNVSTFNGAVTLTANHGGAPVQAQPPVSDIVMAQDARINAGTGTVTIRLLDGAGDPQRVNGAITLSNIAAGRIDVRNLGASAGSDINVLNGGVLAASGTGRAIDLASLNGEVINLAGDAGLVLTGGGHYAIFAATPTGSQIGSFANYARRYNVANAAAYDALNPGGNFAAFRIAPVLTVTANNAARFYGSADPVFTASFAGFQPGDGVAGISGTPQFTTNAVATSSIGTFTINAALGTLLSEQGYQFTFNPGLLTITARPITVTANNLSRIYGNANPALTFTVGGQGLVNGDQLTGALATTASATTGVGTVGITQGSLAASSNYQLTFVGGLLTITRRLLTVTADDLSKLLGQPDPDLTFVLSGDGLVNGDQLSGALVRDPGEAIATFAIRQGTLSAGSNYDISFAEGALTINAPPAPPSINNPSVIDAPLQSAAQEPSMSSEEEEERFGMDFPEQPDAPLISEDPLLDDPVSSGADASLYSGGTAPEPRGEEE